MLNSGQPDCVHSVEEVIGPGRDSYLALALQRGAVGVLVLDSRKKREWRVSSPQLLSSREPSSLPLLLLWQPDWAWDWEGRPTLQSPGTTSYLVWNIQDKEQFQNLISPLFNCDSGTAVHLQGPQTHEGRCSDGKVGPSSSPDPSIPSSLFFQTLPMALETHNDSEIGLDGNTNIKVTLLERLT